MVHHNEIVQIRKNLLKTMKRALKKRGIFWSVYKIQDSVMKNLPIYPNIQLPSGPFSEAVSFYNGNQHYAAIAISLTLLSNIINVDAIASITKLGKQKMLDMCEEIFGQVGRQMFPSSFDADMKQIEKKVKAMQASYKH